MPFIIKKRRVYGGSSVQSCERVTLLKEESRLMKLNSTYGKYAHQLIPIPFIPVMGETYIVVYEGREYRCVAKEVTLMDTLTGVGFGNGSVLGVGEDTKEPFCIGYASVKEPMEMSLFICFSAEDVEETSRTFGIYQEANNKLPEVTIKDEGKFLQVVNGKWAAVAITNGNEVAY